MKTVYLIGGTMGVGKTTLCQYLKKHFNNAVYLDGDWCWDADPFVVNEKTKAMVMDNICHVLNNFIHCDAYEHILFSWVMHQQDIIDEIIERIDTSQCLVVCLSLVCDKDTLIQRLQKDIDEGIRQEDVIQRSLERLPLYSQLRTQIIDTSSKSLDEITSWIQTQLL